MLVRDAAPADPPAVRALVAGAGLPLDALADAALVLVADAGGSPVGTAALERHGADPDTVFVLRSAAVDPAWRGRGVGGALTAAALERVDAADAFGMATAVWVVAVRMHGTHQHPRAPAPAVG